MPPLDERSFDPQVVMINVDHDRSLLRELAELLCEDAPRTYERIREAAEARDPEELWQAAHALKGAVANFAATTAQDLSRALEQKGREKDFEEVDPLVDRLGAELDRLFADLRSFVSTADS